MKTITYDETQWKLVPVEPTQEMLNAFDAGFRTELCKNDRRRTMTAEEAGLRALLNVAPTPSADGQAQQDADKDALLAAGEALSNAAFNLAQREGETLTTDWCQSLDRARKAWDAARAKQGGQS